MQELATKVSVALFFFSSSCCMHALIVLYHCMLYICVVLYNYLICCGVCTERSSLIWCGCTLKTFTTLGVITLTSLRGWSKGEGKKRKRGRNQHTIVACNHIHPNLQMRMHFFLFPCVILLLSIFSVPLAE